MTESPLQDCSRFRAVEHGGEPQEAEFQQLLQMFKFLPGSQGRGVLRNVLLWFWNSHAVLSMYLVFAHVSSSKNGAGCARLGLVWVVGGFRKG